MLHIRHLHKRYANGVQALHDVSLDIPPGMFGLLGPNGAGKSTLMRTIATLQDADSGTIHFGALDMLQRKPDARQLLGYLPQDVGVYPGTSAESMLDHFAVLKGIVSASERRDVVAHLLQRTNLYDVRTRRLGTFSGGMRRRFGIAQALLGNPQLVIVDEPTAGLDPDERNRLHDLLCEIAESAVVMFSTHLVDDVRELCRRLAVLAGGRVLVQGEPEGLIEQLRGRVWRKPVPRVTGAATAHATHHDETTAYQVLSRRLIGGQSIMHVLADHAPDAEFESTEPDLEHVYFAALRAAGHAG